MTFDVGGATACQCQDLYCTSEAAAAADQHAPPLGREEQTGTSGEHSETKCVSLLTRQL